MMYVIYIYIYIYIEREIHYIIAADRRAGPRAEPLVHGLRGEGDPQRRQHQAPPLRGVIILLYYHSDIILYTNTIIIVLMIYTNAII